MKTISDHIRHVQGKPHHVRRRVAFGAATVGTALVAFVWLVSSLGSGVFALKPTSFADSTGAETATVPSADNTNSQNLAGAGAAAVLDNSNAPAHIEIVDVAASTSPKAEQTTIPF